MTKTIVNIKELSSLLGLSRATIYRLCESDQSFPSRVYLSKRRIGFKKKEIDEWIETRKI